MHRRFSDLSCSVTPVHELSHIVPLVYLIIVWVSLEVQSDLNLCPRVYVGQIMWLTGGVLHSKPCVF